MKIGRVLVLILFFAISVMANDMIIVYKVANVDGKITPKTIEEVLKKEGFTVAQNRDMTIPFKKKFKGEDFKIYNLMALYHKETAMKLVVKNPENGIFTPYSFGIYQRKGDKDLRVAFLSAKAMQKMLPSYDEPLYKELEKINRKALLKAIPEAVEEKLLYQPIKVENPIIGRFEYTGDSIDDLKDDIEMEVEDGINQIAFAMANFNDYNYDLKEAKKGDYTFYEVYSLCKIEVIYTISKTHPEASVLAPCSMAFYHKKGDKNVKIILPNIYNWISNFALKDKKYIDLLKVTQKDMRNLLKGIDGYIPIKKGKVKTPIGAESAILVKPKGANKGFALGKYGYFKFEKANKNVYIMHGPVTDPNVENEGYMNNPAIIEGKTALIIIDPGGNYNVGKKILAEIEKVSKKPIIAILNTHKHGDHWFANKNILEKYPNVKIYAHPKMIKEVKGGEAENWYGILERLSKNLKGTKPFAFPILTLVGGQNLSIDGENFYIQHQKITHTDTDIIIEHKNSNTIFLGDNVMRGRLGAFDYSSNIMGNIKLLEDLNKQDEATLYVPGHGPSGTRAETITPYLNYMKTVVKWAKKAYDEDKEAYEVKKEAVADLLIYSKWDGFGNKVGKHLQKALEEIEQSDN